ncbi:hypothetical protein [Pseudoalteromonas fuliginea]|uniref:hypothetical protein n=1 Tax=Pseudoalteromonas fuliginea TaxID=1872678 RepID=UPI0031759BE1
MVDVELAHVRSAASHYLIYSSYHIKSFAFKRQQAARLQGATWLIVVDVELAHVRSVASHYLTYSSDHSKSVALNASKLRATR